MTPRLACSSIVLGLLSSAAIASAQPAPPEAAVTNPADRRSLAVTIYNDRFALVRDVRQVELKRGRVALQFNDVSPSIQPASVSLSLGPKRGAARVIEQGYRYDVLSPSTLGQRADGSTVTVHRVHPGTGEIGRVRGQALARFSGTVPVLRTDEGITFYSSPQAIGFDRLPDRWSSRPSLTWLLEVAQPGPTTFDVAYLTQGMTWQADYVLTLGRQPADAASLVGWITLANNTSVGYPDAHLAVVAGKVNRVSGMLEADEEGGERFAMKKSAEAPARAERSSLADYHLYDLPGRTELPARSSKQVTFLATSRLHPRMHYIAEPWGWSDEDAAGATRTEPVHTELRFDVKESEGLGVPIPEGSVRIFMPDSMGRDQFVAEQRVIATPRDETVKLRIGPAQNVRLTRVLMDQSTSFQRRVSRIQYRLRNHDRVEVTVEVREHEGELVQSNVQAAHPDAATTVFEVRVPAGGDLRWEAEFKEER